MKTEHSNGPLVAGTLLIALGLMALLSQLFRSLIHWSVLWPVAIIVFGGLFFAGMFAGGRSVSGLAVPGTIITGIGLVLLYQNLSGNWESWAYSWSLILVFVGLGIYLMGLYGRAPGQTHAGLKVMKIGLILFVIFGAFFEMIFSFDRSLGFRGLLFPALLILLGLYLVLQRLGVFARLQHSSASEDLPPQSPSGQS